ncbi:WW domain-binding protein 1-like [Lineus longissimus]|uniref:WW domain-binding protein 1-like n=1 Tax=Lineus longissimus TaxID=88925 RepID=UPI002B4F65AC
MALFGFLPIAGTSPLLFLIFTLFKTVNALDFCDQNYWCKEGHCCGNGRCCSYYYELWWFWLIWVLIALMSCCCFYQQRRMRKRRRRHSSSRRSNNRTSTPHAQASTTAPQSFLRPLFDPSKLLTLPTYEEVQDMPKDPPPYDILYETTLEESALGGPSSSLPNPQVGATVETIQVHGEINEIDDSPTASLLNNEEQVAVEMEMPYPSMLPPSYMTVTQQDEGIDSSVSSSQPQELPNGEVFCSMDSLINAESDLSVTIS